MAEATRFKDLKLQPYKQNSLALRKHLKLSSCYYGPFTILQRIGQIVYKLDLPPGSKIHPVFHVSLLKKYVGKAVLPQPNLPQSTDDGVFHLSPSASPSAVLDRREVLRGKDSIAQLLIQWGDETSELFSWEDAKFMAKTYTKFNPWGQGLGNAGSIVVDLVVSGGKRSVELLEEKEMGRAKEEEEVRVDIRES